MASDEDCCNKPKNSDESLSIVVNRVRDRIESKEKICILLFFIKLNENCLYFLLFSNSDETY